MEADINDIFDSIVLSEEDVTKKSFDNGFASGIDSGMKEGYHFGYHRGIEIGREIGFYSGFLEEASRRCETPTPKQHSVFTKFRALLDNIPHENSEDIDFEIKLGEIRSLYKTLSSLMGLPPTLPFTSPSLKY